MAAFERIDPEDLADAFAAELLAAGFIGTPAEAEEQLDPATFREIFNQALVKVDPKIPADETSPQVARQKFGGKRTRSLDDLDRRIPENIDMPLPISINIDGLLEVLELTSHERTYLETRFDGVPRRQVAGRLGWTMQEAESARTSLCRSLRMVREESDLQLEDFVLGGNSRVLCYKQRFASGVSCYSLVLLGRAFPQFAKSEQIRVRRLPPKPLYDAA